jgi:hypothetical protein
MALEFGGIGEALDEAELCAGGTELVMDSGPDQRTRSVAGVANFVASRFEDLRQGLPTVFIGLRDGRRVPAEPELLGHLLHKRILRAAKLAPKECKEVFRIGVRGGGTGRDVPGGSVAAQVLDKGFTSLRMRKRPEARDLRTYPVVLIWLTVELIEGILEAVLLEDVPVRDAATLSSLRGVFTLRVEGTEDLASGLADVLAGGIRRRPILAATSGHRTHVGEVALDVRPGVLVRVPCFEEARQDERGALAPAAELYVCTHQDLCRKVIARSRSQESPKLLRVQWRECVVRRFEVPEEPDSSGVTVCHRSIVVGETDSEPGMTAKSRIHMRRLLPTDGPLNADAREREKK